MKTTTLNISDHTDFQGLLEINELKPGDTFQSLCVAICQQSHTANVPSVRIKIAAKLLPNSYQMVAAMFARSCSVRIPYASCQSYREGKYVVFYAGNARIPVTFKGRFLHALRSKKYFIANRNDIPLSYLEKPVAASRLAQNALGRMRIAISAKPETISWKVVDKK